MKIRNKIKRLAFGKLRTEIQNILYIYICVCVCVCVCVSERETVLAASTVQFPVTIKLNHVTECSIVTGYCSVLAANTVSLSLSLTHTHTHIYIYIERERERERVCFVFLFSTCQMLVF
jgi:hypothetical protein